MLTILLVISLLVNGALGYAIYNLLKKVELFEDFFDQISESLISVLDTMRQIDIKGSFGNQGAFEQDDEVGAVFQTLKHTIDTLEQFVVRESDGKKEKVRGGFGGKS